MNPRSLSAAGMEPKGLEMIRYAGFEPVILWIMGHFLWHGVGFDF